jgi:hypothetical protein
MVAEENIRFLSLTVLFFVKKKWCNKLKLLITLKCITFWLVFVKEHLQLFSFTLLRLQDNDRVYYRLQNRLCVFPFFQFWLWVSLRPKPDFGIRNQNSGPILVSVSEPIFFSETFFFKLFSFFHKRENKPRSSKIIQKYLIFGRKFGFRGPFMMAINTSCFG